MAYRVGGLAPIVAISTLLAGWLRRFLQNTSVEPFAGKRADTVLPALKSDSPMPWSEVATRFGWRCG